MNNHYAWFTIILLVCSAWLSPNGVANVNSKSKEAPANHQKSSRWAMLPAIARAEETGWQFGALLMYFLPMISTENKQSRVIAAALYTLNEQYLVSISPSIYTLDGKYIINGGITWRFWPANYYGIGNNTADQPIRYEAKQRELNIHIERNLTQGFRAGGGIRYSKELIEFIEGDLNNITTPIGATGGTAIGLSFSVVHDTRDDVDAPYTGHLVRYKPYFYRQDLNSDFSYRIHELDLRQYFKVNMKSTFALAAHLRTTNGEVPFRELSTPDGISKLRGIELGRYRDKHLLSTQAEYRFPLANRLGVTLFAESAQVAKTITDFKLNESKYSVGAGLRWQMVPGNRFHIRADFSYVDKGFGLVINVGEAF